MSPLPCIAIEGGGTRTSAGLYRAGACLAEIEGGPCNPSAYGPEHCARIITGLCKALQDSPREPFDLYLALAGAGAPVLDTPMADALFHALPIHRIVVCGDLQPLLLANAGNAPAAMVIAGTGSSVVAQDAHGKLHSVGGRGALLGDEGSAYAIVVAALRAVADARDGLGPATTLEDALPKAAGLQTYSDFIPWHPRATKSEIAALVKTVIALAEAGDDAACACVAEEADKLAKRVAAAQSRAGLGYDEPLFLQGGMFRMFPLYRAVFTVALEGRGVVMTPTDLHTLGHQAVVALASADPLPAWCRVYTAASKAPGVATTETAQDGPPLDTLDAEGIVEAMHAADLEAVLAVKPARTAIAAAIRQAAESLTRNGRILYIGAGTSGRLGVLDASECPPTFGVDPERVVGIIAGGEAALRNSVEGAEDDEAQGRADIAAQAPGADDFVLGIAASGTTPYVLAALAEAKDRGAQTGLLCCNPAATAEVDILIALNTGPEVVAGSTRLKAGTATKLVLNQISTGALTLTGHVYRGRMVRMRAVNAKLRARAIRMVAELGAVEIAGAEATLKASDYDIAVALIALAQHVNADAARARLEAAGGHLRHALENTQ